MKTSSIKSLCENLRYKIEVYFLYAMLSAFIIGIAAAALCGFQESWLRPLALLAGGCALFSLLTRRLGWLLPVAAILGFGWHGIEAMQLDSFAGRPDEAVFFEGKVVEVMSREENYFAQLAEQKQSGYTFVMQGEDHNGWQGRIMVTSSPVAPKVGDKLRVAGIVYDFVETYNFDLPQNNYFRNNAIAAAVRPVPDGITFLRLAGASPYTWGEAVRERVFHDLSALPDIQQALIKGIAFGETGMLSERQNSILQQTGIMHIFAVSGLHIGYVVFLGGTVMEFLRRRLGFPLWLGPLAVGALVLFFGFVVGFSPSVLRATIMTLAALISQASGNRHYGTHALIIAAFLLLLAKPMWIFQAGFLLSFAAAAGIVFGASCMRQLVPSQVLAVSLAAQLMTMPILAYCFNTISFIGLLLSPLVAVGAGIVVIMALLAMLLSFVGLAYIPLVGAGLLAELIYKGTELFAVLPNMFTYLASPSPTVLLIYYLLVLVAYGCLIKAKNLEDAFNGSYSEEAAE